MDSKTKAETYVPEWVKVLRQAILESEKEEKERGGAGKPTDNPDSVFGTSSQKLGGDSNRMDRLEQIQ